MDFEKNLGELGALNGALTIIQKKNPFSPANILGTETDARLFSGRGRCNASACIFKYLVRKVSLRNAKRWLYRFEGVIPHGPISQTPIYQWSS